MKRWHDRLGCAGGTAALVVLASMAGQASGEVTYTDRSPSDDVTYTGGANAMFGEDSWKWLLLQPLAEEK